MKESEFWGSISEELRQHITDIDNEERLESAENRRGAFVYGDLYESIDIEGKK
jgi:hypothetical protein